MFLRTIQVGYKVLCVITVIFPTVRPATPPHKQELQHSLCHWGGAAGDVTEVSGTGSICM